MSLPNQFKLYLESLSLSRKTIRNYLSDLSHFTAWATLKLRTTGYEITQDQNLIPYLSCSLIEEYRIFLLTNTIPARTINRRLSTLRRFGRFLQEKGLIITNPAVEIINVEIYSVQEEQRMLLVKFRKHLEQEGLTGKTRRNYISDVRGFLRFAEQKLEISA